MKCQSRIKKEHKTCKASSTPPVYYPDGQKAKQNPHADGLPECGGEITVTAQATEELTYGGSYPTMEIVWICSRCRYAWVPQRRAFEIKLAGGDPIEITATVESFK